MSQNRLQVRESDLKRVLESLSKECPNHLITIVVDHPKVTFLSEDAKGNKVEIVLRDDQYYMLPVRIKQEPL